MRGAEQGCGIGRRPPAANHKSRHRSSAVDFDGGGALKREGSSCGLLLSLGKDLLLELVWLGETKGDLVSGQLMVAVHNSIDFALHGVLVQWVQLNLLVLLSVERNSDGLGSDVGWEHLKLNHELESIHLIEAINKLNEGFKEYNNNYKKECHKKSPSSRFRGIFFSIC